MQMHLVGTIIKEINIISETTASPALHMDVWFKERQV